MLSVRNVVVVVCLLGLVATCFGATPYIFYSEELPDEKWLMPTIANGHVGFNLFSDALHMNGLYNGNTGYTHRARIPNYSNISVTPASGNYSMTYSLNVDAGVFQINVENKEMKIIHLIYAHRYFNRAIVNQIYVYRLDSEDTLRMNVRHDPGESTTDIVFNDPPLKMQLSGTTYDQNFEQPSNQTTIHLIQGNTVDVENEDYQKAKRHVCCIWNHVPEEITLKPEERFGSFRFVMTVDEFCSVAKQEITDVFAKSSKDLMKMHRTEWSNFWNSFNIHVGDNLKLERAIYSSLFYIASSLPSLNTNYPTDPFYGLSPSGLGRGGRVLMDYQGHSFWDTEIWMFPTIMHMDTRWAKALLSYRYRSLQAARDNAHHTGYKGARFPWESGYTGAEVTPPCCPLMAQQQIHITADIAFAAKTYFALSNDLEWLNKEGCPLVESIAEFWADRVEYNVNTRMYDIKTVVGPDEDHDNVTNNAYTNVGAKNALYFGDLVSSLDLPGCGNSDNQQRPSWTTVADRIAVPYDEKLDYHPQYEKYDRSTIIKQADAILLGYPLLYPMNKTTRHNDLEIYDKNTRSDGPAMTWAMHSINHLDIGNYLKANDNFQRGFEDYIREPFQVWSEVIRGHVGAGNFITGAGGFLQSLVNGYAGVRIHLGYMEIRKPIMPPNSSKFVVSGVKYLGSSFKITVDDNGIFFQCLKADKDMPLNLYDGVDSYPITPYLIFNITMDRIIIKPSESIFGSKLKLKDLWKINRN